jgi:hypothetical protein
MKKQKKYIYISIIPNKLGYFCIARYNSYTRKLSSDKYTI